MILVLCLRVAGVALRLAGALVRPSETRRLAALRRQAQRETWRRVASGDGLPDKVRAYLEGL